MVTIKNKEHLIQNGETQLSQKARRLALECLEHALNAADPKQIVKSKLWLENSTFHADGCSFDLEKYNRGFRFTSFSLSRCDQHKNDDRAASNPPAYPGLNPSPPTRKPLPRPHNPPPNPKPPFPAHLQPSSPGRSRAHAMGPPPKCPAEPG